MSTLREIHTKTLYFKQRKIGDVVTRPVLIHLSSSPLSTLPFCSWTMTLWTGEVALDRKGGTTSLWLMRFPYLILLLSLPVPISPQWPQTCCHFISANSDLDDHMVFNKISKVSYWQIYYQRRQYCMLCIRVVFGLEFLSACIWLFQKRPWLKLQTHSKKRLIPWVIFK